MSNSINNHVISYPEAHRFVRLSLISRVPSIIIGNPGIGKTSIVRQQAEALGLSCMEQLGYLYEPVDFRGLLVPNDADQTTISYSLGRWPLQRFVDAGKIPQKGVLLLDEILNSHTDVLTAYAEPLCDHRVNGEPLASGWTIIATGNKLGGGTSAKPLPSHVANRVAIAELEPDWASWLAWTPGRIRPELVGYFQIQNGADLFVFDPTKNLPNQPYLTPRSLELLSRQLDAWQHEFPSEKPPMWLYCSAVGAYGAKLYATLDYISELVPFQAIVTSPKQAPIPSSAGAIYAQVQIIVAGTKQSVSGKKSVPKPVAAAVSAYASRMRPEVQAVTHNRLLSSVDEWKDTQEFVEWYTENQKSL